MPITITKTFAGQATLQAADLDTNFTTVASYSSSIPGTDIQSATVPTAQLVNQYSEQTVNLCFTNQTAAQPNIGTKFPLVTWGLPNLSGDTPSYIVTAAAFALANGGSAGSTTFDVEWGWFGLGLGTGGTWTKNTQIINAFTVTGAAGVDETGSSNALTVANATLTPNASAPSFIGLFLTSLGTGAFDLAGDFLCVSLTLKRLLRS